MVERSPVSTQALENKDKFAESLSRLSVNTWEGSHPMDKGLGWRELGPDHVLLALLPGQESYLKI